MLFISIFFFLEKKVYLSQWFLYSCWATATWFIETDIFRRRKKNVEDTPRKVSQLFFFIVKCIILFFLQIYTTMNVFECLFAPLQVFIDHPLIHCSNERIFLFVKSRSLYQKWKKKRSVLPGYDAIAENAGVSMMFSLHKCSNLFITQCDGFFFKFCTIWIWRVFF